jgi:dynein heavy chain
VDAKAAGIDETPALLYEFFLDRVRNNLHLVLCMSPIGEACTRNPTPSRE